MNQQGKRVLKAVTVAGKRQQLSLVRLIFQLEPGAEWPPPPDALLGSAAAAENAPPKPRKGAKKGKKGGASGAAAAAAAGAVSDVSVSGGRKVLSEELQATKGGLFEVEAVREPISQSGRYGAPRLAHTFSPC